MQIWLTILVSWPAAGRADQPAGARIVRDDRLDPRIDVRLAPAHHAESAVLGSRLAAGDGRVDEADAVLSRALAKSSRATSAEAVVWSTKIAPFFMPAKAPRLAERHGAQVVVVADAGEDDLGSRRPPRPASAPSVPRSAPPMPRPCGVCGCRR